MWRHIASNFLSLVIVVFMVAGGAVVWGQRQFTGPGPLAEATCVRVPSGGSMSAVAADLAERGAISSSYVFRVGADYTQKSSLLKAGSFLVPAHATMGEIIDAVTRGGQSTCGTQVIYRIGVARAGLEMREMDTATGQFTEVASFLPGSEPAPADWAQRIGGGDIRYSVVLAEGVTSWQVADALRRVDFMSGTIDRAPDEGTLAPQAYEIAPGMARPALIAQMQAKQKLILSDLWAARASDLPYRTPEEALVMASIVEKETGIAAERRDVASVFVNRLKQGMRLQTDPTVIYGVTRGQGVLGRGLRQSELRTRTPWNTYIIDGLPPTPIANPGLESIRATLNPASTDYLYFVADGTGGHVFAATLAEHNQNVTKWRAIEAERARRGDAPAPGTGTGTGVDAGALSGAGTSMGVVPQTGN